MNHTNETLHPQLDRVQKQSLVLGTVVLGVCATAGFFAPNQFFRSYLMAYLFWSGITFGSFVVVMIHHLTGGAWGFLIRRMLESGMRTLTLAAILVVPLLFGIPYLYSWSHPAVVAGSTLLQHKQILLNVPFFLVRTAVYFGVFFLLAYFLNKWSDEQDRTASFSPIRRLYNLSGPGLIIYGLIMTFASLDWVMSLEPDWFSTMFSALFMVGQVLSSLAFVIAVLTLLASRTELSQIVAPKYLNDLGNMLLAFVILWAYLAFSQFLIIWSGNLTDEIPWYLHRIRSGWGAIAVSVIVFHFGVPFLLLLSRWVKRRAFVLSIVAGGMLVMRLMDMFWTVEPTFNHSLTFHWLDWATAVGIGGIWVGVFIRHLKRRPMLPVHDPGWREMLAGAAGD